MPGDAYETPELLCAAVCMWLHQKGLTPMRILEPSAAQGNFVRAARKQWPKAFIVANEISPMLVERTKMRSYLLELASLKQRNAERKEDGKPPLLEPDAPKPTLDTREVLKAAGADEVRIGDALWLSAELLNGPVDLSLGNPPYSAGGGAAAHVTRQIDLLAPGGVVANVLKMHFRGTAARIDFWKEHRFAADPPLVPRPDFTGDGRDTVEYTLYCWHRAKQIGHEWRVHCADAIEWKENDNE